MCIRDRYNAGKVSPQASPAIHFRPLTDYVVAVLYDDQNFQNTSLTLTSTISTGCLSTGYANNMPGGWDNRVESGIGYLSCNYILMYENTGTSGSFNPCTSSCASFGLLNNQGSSYKLQRTYP